VRTAPPTRPTRGKPLATIDVITPTILDMLTYMSGKGWDSYLANIGFSSPYFYRSDIGALNQYRFYGNAGKTVAPSKISWDDALTLKNSYTEYHTTYTTVYDYSYIRGLYVQRNNYFNDPSRFTIQGPLTIYNDGVLFTSQYMTSLLEFVGGLYYAFYHLLTRTRNAQNQGVDVATEVGYSIVTPDTTSPMTIEVSAGAPVIQNNIPIEDLVTSNEAFYKDTVEMLNDIAENIAGSGELTTTVATNITEFLGAVQDGIGI